MLGEDYKKLKVGDLLFNPGFGDLWIVFEGYNEEKNKDEKYVALIHADYTEDIEVASAFIKIGNVYDYAKERLGGKQ